MEIKEQISNFKSMVKGKMIDLPEVSKVQNRNIENEDLQDRLVSIPCDYNVEFPNEQYDDIFLFAVIHQESQINVNRFMEKRKLKKV